MRSSYRRPQAARVAGARRGCLRGSAALLFIAALLLLVYAFGLRPMLSRAVADRIAPLPVATAMAADGGGRVDGLLPTAIAALPPGEVVLTEERANEFLAARPDALAPLEAARLSFSEGRASAAIRAYGVVSVASVSLAAEQGRLVVTGARLEPPLAYVLSANELARLLAERLNAELTAQGRRIDVVRIEEGRLILVTS
ncbi:MAG: hypothetical protein RMK84_10325 [Oscillochloridaceae bacterium]|nr:hypothetical protein [Chloroflexaceae bacterium]MDW8390509.1 hypothetical protein [Oscillochloridaceae bacterium]